MRRTGNTLIIGSTLGSLTLGSGVLAQDGSEVDLTGTWEGTQVCDELFGGDVVNFVDTESPLLFAQSGNTFRFLYRSVTDVEGEEVAAGLVYEGVVQDIEGSDLFEGMASICGGDYEAQEIVRLRRIETSEDESRFDAESIFFTADFPGFEGDVFFDTCKWAYERVSTEPPDVPECERPGIGPLQDEGD